MKRISLTSSSSRPRALAAAALMSTLPWTAAHAATALGAGMDLQVVVGLGENSSRSRDGSDWFLPDLSPVSGGVSGNLENNQGDRIQGQISGEATWSSANRGRVEMRAAGWTFDVQDVSARVMLRDGNRDWRYAFLAGPKDTLFRMDFIVAGFGDNRFGLEGWTIALDGGPETSRQQSTGGTVFDPTSFGTFLSTVTPGHAYVISLRNNADLATSHADRTSSMWGTFDWRIETAPIPEPRTWALFATGLLACGARARRQGAQGQA